MYRASTDPGIQCEKNTVPLPKRQTVASCQSAATGSISTSQLALRRQRQNQKKKGHRQSFFYVTYKYLDDEIHLINKDKKSIRQSFISNAILLSEEDAELVNPYFNKIFRIAKIACLTHVGRRRQSTVILHQLKGVESKAKKKNTEITTVNHIIRKS